MDRFRWHNSDETSGANMLRACGERLTDRTLWSGFQERFQGLIFRYLMRILRYEKIHEDHADLVPDLAQEVYLKLVRQNGQTLRSFRGETDFSVMAFLARTCVSVVADHYRYESRDKRKGELISIEDLRRKETSGKDATEFDGTALSSILAWVDVERVVQGDPDQKNAQRNALIFKLHYIDGLSPEAIAKYPGFDLSKSGVQTILARLKKRIQQ